MIPIITYGNEIWNPNKTETKPLNALNIIKRILMTPQTTPREVLYIETGLLDPETISHKQRIMMNHRLRNSDNERLNKLANTEASNSWKELAEESMKRMEVSQEDIQGKKHSTKSKVRKKAISYFKKANLKSNMY